MKKLLSCLLFLTSMPVFSDTLWDGYVVINASIQKDGTVLYCKESHYTHLTENGYCYKPGFVAKVTREKPVPITVQEYLELTLSPKLSDGKKPSLVGVAPGIVQKGKALVHVVSDSQFIAYYKIK